MVRDASEQEDSKNMSVSYSTELSKPYSQTLPSFRELLPDYLHKEIDSAPYQSRSNHRQGAGDSLSTTGTDLESRNRTVPVARNDHASHRPLFSRDQRYDDVSMRPDRFQSDHSRLQNGRLSPPLPQLTSINPPTTAPPRRPSSNSSNAITSLPPIRSFTSPSREGRLSYPNDSTLSPTDSTPYSSDLRRRNDSDLSANSSSPPQGYIHSSSLGPHSLQHASSSLNLPSKLDHRDHSSYSAYQTSLSSEQDYPPHLFSAMQSSKFNIGGSDAGMDPREKKRRGNLPKPVTDMLRAWLCDHLDHPYPSEEDKQMFIDRTGLTISQISNWFINARRRQVPALRNQARVSESGRNTRHSSPQSDDGLISAQACSVQPPDP